MKYKWGISDITSYIWLSENRYSRILFYSDTRFGILPFSSSILDALIKTLYLQLKEFQTKPSMGNALGWLSVRQWISSMEALVCTDVGFAKTGPSGGSPEKSNLLNKLLFKLERFDIIENVNSSNEDNGRYKFSRWIIFQVGHSSTTNGTPGY